MATSLSNLVDNLARFTKLNLNMDMIMKNVTHVKLDTKIVRAVLNTQTLKII